MVSTGRYQIPHGFGSALLVVLGGLCVVPGLSRASADGGSKDPPYVHPKSDVVPALSRASGVVSGFSRTPEPVNTKSFQRWLERDVAYLITAEERRAVRALRTDEDRERFVRDFWARRDPTPGTPENELRDEHYRRLDDADRRFSAGLAGWRTDRGRLYITWGPPDYVETNPAGVRGFVLGAFSEAPELPSETWTYENLGGRRFGTGRAQIVFVDRGGGDYRLLTDPNDANLAYVYRLNTAANPLQYESAAFVDPATGERQTQLAAEARAQVLGPEASKSAATNPFERLQIAADLRRPAADVLAEIARSQRARRLEADVRAQVFTRRFPIELEVPVFHTAGDQAYCPLAVSIPGEAIRFEAGDRHTATLLVRAEVREEPTGKSVRRFTEAVNFRLTDDTYARGREHGFSYHKALSLPPGRYLVEVLVTDEASQGIGLATSAVTVPPARQALLLEGVVLAEHVSLLTAEPESAPFALGSLNVVPRVGRRFARGETLHAVVQVRGFARAPDGPFLTADYTILAGDQAVLRTELSPVDARRLAPEHERVIVAQPLALNGLEPGRYTLQIKVIDHVAASYAIERVDFEVR